MDDLETWLERVYQAGGDRATLDQIDSRINDGIRVERYPEQDSFQRIRSVST
jgi:hypothetical protein